VVLDSSASNAAPEWQARSLGWRRGEMSGACPLEGLVGLRLRKPTNDFAYSLHSLVRIRIYPLAPNN
jgi:hypothetical protein